MQPEQAAPWDVQPQAGMTQEQLVQQQPVQAMVAPQAVNLSGQPAAYAQPMMMAPVMMTDQPPKQMIVALLLGLFIGTLGIHNFYLGHTGRGIAQLLITILTFGIGVLITGPWVLIEIIMMVTGSLKDGMGRPLA
ncbi:MAG: TM2 domain-containing protein [Poseidonia sp.]